MQNKLDSTEQTVRSQTEKMKYYRNLLENAGLLHPLPKRTQSESSLNGDVMIPSDGAAHSRTTSTENLAGGELSPRLSPTASLGQFVDFGQTNIPEELKDQVRNLWMGNCVHDSVSRDICIRWEWWM